MPGTAVASGGVSDAPSVGRHVRLRPLRTSDYDTIYSWAAEGHVPWHWQGRPVGPEGFRDTLWSGILFHLVIESIETGSPIGLFTAYGANHHHQFCYCQIGVVPEWRMSGLPVEAGLLGLDLLFRKFNFRKVYAEVGSDKFDLYESSEGSGFEVEGRLTEHIYADGTFYDMLTLAIRRAAWSDRIAPLVRRLQSAAR